MPIFPRGGAFVRRRGAFREKEQAWEVLNMVENFMRISHGMAKNFRAERLTYEKELDIMAL